MTLDASIAIKWLVDEDDSDKARALLDGRNVFIAPDLLFAEVANALWSKVVTKKLPAQAVGKAGAALSSYMAKVVPAPDLMQRSLDIALELGHPAYDCFYIACAELNDAPVVTDDRRLLNVIAAHPDLARHVTPLHA